MSEEYSPPEFISIPEKGIYDAFLVHLRMNSDRRRRLCDGKLCSDEPIYDNSSSGIGGFTKHTKYFCRACQILAKKPPNE